MLEDFPSLHPLIVHFPIVLILLATALQAIVLWKPDWKQIRLLTLFIMAGAFLSSLLASTLFHAMITSDVPKKVLEIFEEHEKYAQLTLWMSGITLLLKAIGVFFKINKRLYNLIVLIAAIIMAIFLSMAGHLGARLTHIEGVGPMGKYLMKDHGGSHDEKDMQGMDMQNDSTMKMKDTTMLGMEDMPGMKNTKDNGMEDMPGMKNTKDNSMKDKPGMKNTKDNSMKDMPGMKNTKDNSMKDMPGMKNTKDNSMKDMPGMNNTKDENMKDMPGMNNIKDNNMKDMPGMDNAKDNNMKDMPGMRKKMNSMDTLRFPDNNPGKKNKKSVKQ